MAEAVLGVVLDNLSSFIRKELAVFLGIDQDFQNLVSLLTTIKATLEDAEEKQFTDRAIKDWLLKLKDAAYVLDDILDECSTQALELEYHGFKGGPSHKVLSSLYLKHIVFRYKMAKKMKRIRQRLNEIAEERRKFHLTEIVRERRSRVIDWRETTSIITQPQVYGRDQDRDQIVNFLVHDASELDHLSVYPLIGIGGLGKTTLAQLIFNYERIVNHFELRIWVCVSEDFSPKRMTKAIIGSASGNVNGCEDLDLDPLQRRLQDLLQGKRYLLVLDDVWDEKQENWERLKYVLACGGKGASVLVTTRLPKVAKIMGTMPPHDLSMLSDSECWELFKQRAFEPNEAERAELVVIGKEILKKCGGVPLAAIALGSLLRFKKEEKEWIYVKESKLWSLPGENTVMAALRLSYLYLPIKLRQCFAFCAVFPKDSRMEKEVLIDLWTANGFLSSSEMLEAKDIGDEVWNELYWRSFFQDIERDDFGKIIFFKMHDLIHDLAQSVTEEICCSSYDDGEINVSERLRHLAIYERISYEKANSIQLHLAKSLKTYMNDVCNYRIAGQLSCQVFKCYSLRVLQSYGLNNLPTSIDRLKYLRHLDISYGTFQTLPKSLCRLFNLQVLKLDHCHNLQKLPKSLILLKSLQHLSLSGCNSLSRFLPQIRKLTSLRTLSKYVVGKKSGSLLEELGQLNLEGDLHIKNLERVKSVSDAKEANMSRKHLTKLWLSWERNEEAQSQENVEEILDVLQPHAKQLQALGVGGYTGACFPQWMSSASFKALNSLAIVDCKSCLNLPELDKLPSLKNVKISNMSLVEYLCEESYHGGPGGLMNLKVLILEKMPNLVRLSREDGEKMFPQLSKLEITECPNLLGFSCLPSLIFLCIKGKCNQELLSSIHKLRSLKSIYFTRNEELTCFPNWNVRNLTSLENLGFQSMPKLDLLPTEIIHLHALKVLQITYCHSIKTLTNEVLQGLHSLIKLEIMNCNQFNISASFKFLTTLETLQIGGCLGIANLHVALQHMTCLQCLILSDFPELESLPDCLGNLSLLNRIEIYSCPNLTYLPISIQALSGLKSLSIHDCPELEKRCQEETGEDWAKIAHVNHIIIRNQNTIPGVSYLGLGFEKSIFLWNL